MIKDHQCDTCGAEAVYACQDFKERIDHDANMIVCDPVGPLRFGCAQHRVESKVEPVES